MASKRKESVFHIADLCCATEEQVLRRKLEGKPIVEALEFNIVSHRLKVLHTGEDAQILRWLRETGMPGQLVGGKSGPVRGTQERARRLSTLVSAVLLATGVLLSAYPASEVLTTALYLAAIVIGGWSVVLKAYHAVRGLTLDMNFLMTIAVVGAVAIGDYAEGAGVVVLFAVSLLLESLSVDRSRRAIESLMKLSPNGVTLLRDGHEAAVPLEEVRVGDVILVRPGERIGVDGTVARGSSSVDESSLTGESMPAAKAPGNSVFAGTFNRLGMLEIEAVKPASDSTLARIVHLVEEAQSARAPSQTFIETFARYYTPAVFLLALVVATVPPIITGEPFVEWLYRALVLLVIACPCALVISTPVGIVSALTNAARRGILIKGGKHLELLSAVRAVAFDKTGTLTRGEPAITEIIPLNSVSPRELLRLAAAIEQKSEHHLASSFVQKARQEGVSWSDLSIDRFESITGKGVRAFLDGADHVLGNHMLLEELGLCSPQHEQLLDGLEARGHTTVTFVRDREVLGVFAIGDPARKESAPAIGELKQLGIRNITLLTGDSERTGRSVADAVGISDVRAGLLPPDKLRVIRDLQQHSRPVAMIGDGINDAPALAAADVGIAMGGVGSDTALETADVVLMSDDLLKVPESIRLGRSAVSVIRQNILIALVTKAVFLVLGVLGLSSLWLAILADDGAALVVILNSLRLLRQPDGTSAS